MNMNEIPTPRTDAHEVMQHGIHMVPAAHARNLERELAKSKEQICKAVRGEFDQICSYCGMVFPKDSNQQWEDLQKHIRECDKHPMAALQQELARRHEEYSKALNKRTDVETVLLAVATGKREPLTPEECRALAQKLGNP